MKSPHFFLQDEQHNDVEPVIAIRYAQADAILHALHVIRTTEPKQADEALTQLVFELLGEEFKIPRPTEQELREEKEEADIQKGLKL